MGLREVVASENKTVNFVQKINDSLVNIDVDAWMNDAVHNVQTVALCET